MGMCCAIVRKREVLKVSEAISIQSLFSNKNIRPSPWFVSSLNILKNSSHLMLMIIGFKVNHHFLYSEVFGFVRTRSEEGARLFRCSSFKIENKDATLLIPKGERPHRGINFLERNTGIS